MILDRKEFLAERTEQFMRELQITHPDIPEHAAQIWARSQAEKEWMKGRVNSRPAEINTTRINVHGGDVVGVQIRFNPEGPMVSVQSLSYGELRELVFTGLQRLKDNEQLTHSDRVALDAYVAG